MKDTFNSLAIKLFDFFMKKASIDKLIMFSREKQYWSNGSGKFGLNAVFSDPGFSERSIFFGTYGTLKLATFFDRKHDAFIEDNHLKKFTIAKFPKFLKVAVMRDYLKSSGKLVHSTGHLKKTIIPAASSLEELMIKIELES